MASFGVRLKQQREQRGLTLEEISGTTKIGTRMLTALEQDHFDQLPGGIFNKGFIRAYARCVGLDEDQAIADYLVASGSFPSEKEKEKEKIADGAVDLPLEPRTQTDRRDSNLPWGTFAILLLLLALGFAAWGFYSPQARRNRQQTLAPTPASAPIVAASASSAAPTPVSAAPASTLSQPPPSSPAQIPKPLSLRITLHADSWLSITSDGQPVLQGSSFSAPTQKTIRAEKEIVVKAGNISALELEFNGKKLPPQGAVGEVKTLTFDAAGLRPAAPPSLLPPNNP